MRTRYLYKVITLCLLLSSTCLIGQYNELRTEAFRWYTPAQVELRVINKYGDIELLTWDKDSIYAEVRISASGRNSSQVRDLFNRIDLETDEISDIITLQSDIRPKSQSGISRFFREHIPIDLNKSNVDIRMVIYAPAQTRLDIENKFGHVSIDRFPVRVKAVVEHGDLRINGGVHDLNLTVSFGDINMVSAEEVDINIRNGKVFARRLGNTRVYSQGSAWYVDTIAYLDLYSSKDEYFIDHCGPVRGMLKYGFLKLKHCPGDIRLDVNYSKLYVDHITKVPEIELTSIASDAYLEMSGYGYEASARLERGELRLPKAVTDVQKEWLDEPNEIRRISARMDGDGLGLIRIDARKSNISIFK